MTRTFKGFLKEYCRNLSGLDTTSLRRLAAAARNNARLVEPLFALAAIQGKADYLVSISKGAWFYDDYVSLSRQLEEHESLESLLLSATTPRRYAAVLDAFRSRNDEQDAKRRIAGLLQPKIMEALNRRGMTRYQLCRDLGLNYGNVYAFLAGDSSKVSKETAEKILLYVKSAGIA